MITADGWFDWMDREPGPADKVYSDPCTSEIVVFHDAVGYYAGWMSRLKSTARDAQGRYTPYAAASVTGWLPYKAGETPVQHFSIFKSCWASGSRFLNIHGNAFENESAPIYTLPSGAWAFVGSTGPGDWHSPPPQSDWQVACAARIEADIAAFKGWPLTYWRRPTSAADVTATEYEHNETTRWGGLYSSCPNGRIRWSDIARLRQEEDMTPEQDERMKRIEFGIVQLHQWMFDAGWVVTPPPALPTNNAGHLAKHAIKGGTAGGGTAGAYKITGIAEPQ